MEAFSVYSFFFFFLKVPLFSFLSLIMELIVYKCYMTYLRYIYNKTEHRKNFQ